MCRGSEEADYKKKKCPCSTTRYVPALHCIESWWGISAPASGVEQRSGRCPSWLPCSMNRIWLVDVLCPGVPWLASFNFVVRAMYYLMLRSRLD